LSDFASRDSHWQLAAMVDKSGMFSVFMKKRTTRNNAHHQIRLRASANPMVAN